MRFKRDLGKKFVWGQDMLTDCKPNIVKSIFGKDSK